MPKEAVWVGIDNGNRGAIAVVFTDDRAEVWPMPVLKVKDTKKALDMVAFIDLLDAIAAKYEIRGCALERAQAMPKQGVSSTFKIGEAYGAIKMALTDRKWRWDTVRPTTWNAEVLRNVEGEGKERAIRYVQRRFPATPLVLKGGRVPHDGLAEAICLAVYARATMSPVMAKSFTLTPPRVPSPPPKVRR